MRQVVAGILVFQLSRMSVVKNGRFLSFFA